MPGKMRKPGKGDGSYVVGKPAKQKPMAAKGNPKTPAVMNKKAGKRGY